jgi:uncharacterized protein YukE
MARVECEVSDLKDLIAALGKTDAEILRIVRDLDRTVEEKTGRWSGDSRQSFLLFFREWRRGADVLSSALRKGIHQLQTMIDEFQKLPG